MTIITPGALVYLIGSLIIQKDINKKHLNRIKLLEEQTNELMGAEIDRITGDTDWRGNHTSGEEPAQPAGKKRNN